MMRFEAGFLHTHADNRKSLFALVTRLEHVGKLDTTLGCAYMREVGQDLIGIPSIGSDMEYVLDTDYKERGDLRARVHGSFRRISVDEPLFQPGLPTLLHVVWKIVTM